MVESGGVLWQQLRKMVSLIDNLRDIGLHEHIVLPKIVVLGTQSSGKSSVLESIVGMDFLPRGDGVCTRRPLELRLVHLADDAAPWGIFEEYKGKKFTNFAEIRKGIEDLTDKVAGAKKNIVNQPIVLTIYSHTCPDLTLIDLPGITRIPLANSDQPKNIEEITKNMALSYVTDERTIILTVIPANQDLSTSEALKMAQDIDKKGLRTIGVFTKIDIMDRGTNAKRMLTGQEVPLKLGYVGIKNRSQADIQNKMSVREALELEKAYFENDPIYNSVPKECMGTAMLSKKLTRILFTHIRHALPDISGEIEEKMQEAREKQKNLGDPLPQSNSEKMQLLWNMVTEFCGSFKNTISGRYDSKRSTKKIHKELTGGAKIKMYFYNLFGQFTTEKYSATSQYSDRDIQRAIILHEGDNLPGFPAADVFLYLIQPQLALLKDPAIDCLNDIYAYLESLANGILEKTFARFPSVGGTLMETVQEVMLTEKNKAEDLVISIIEAQQGYMFTNDHEYLKNRTEIVPQQKGGEQTDAQMTFTQEIRARIDTYFKVVVRTIRDAIPKAIGFFLVKAIQEKMQFEMYARISNNEQIANILGEPPSIMAERKALENSIATFKEALRLLKKDPDLTSSAGGALENELFKELTQYKKDQKLKKSKESAQRHTKAATPAPAAPTQAAVPAQVAPQAPRPAQPGPPGGGNLFGQKK